MKILYTAAAMAVISLGLMTGCAATKSGDGILVSPSEPHAILSTALPPNPGNYYVQIIWIDGEYLTNMGRDAYWVSPGKHEIGFRAILESDRGVLMTNPATSRRTDMPTLNLDLKQGYTYYFAAKVPPPGLPYQWKPFLMKKVDNGD